MSVTAMAQDAQLPVPGCSPVAADLRCVYAAATADEAHIRLQEFDDKWGADYLTCSP